MCTDGIYTQPVHMKQIHEKWNAQTENNHSMALHYPDVYIYAFQ